MRRYETDHRVINSIEVLRKRFPEPACWQKEMNLNLIPLFRQIRQPSIKGQKAQGRYKDGGLENAEPLLSKVTRHLTDRAKQCRSIYYTELRCDFSKTNKQQGFMFLKVRRALRSFK